MHSFILFRSRKKPPVQKPKSTAKVRKDSVFDRHASQYDFSDLDKYSLIISDSPLAEEKALLERKLFSPHNKSNFVSSSTPNLLGRTYTLRNNSYNKSKCGGHTSVHASPNITADIGQLSHASNCEEELNKLHLSSIAGSPESPSNGELSVQGSLNGISYVGSDSANKFSTPRSTLSKDYEQQGDMSEVVQPSPYDVPASNLRSCKKSQRWYHQILPNRSKKNHTEMDGLCVSLDESHRNSFRAAIDAFSDNCKKGESNFFNVTMRKTKRDQHVQAKNFTGYDQSIHILLQQMNLSHSALVLSPGSLHSPNFSGLKEYGDGNSLALDSVGKVQNVMPACFFGCIV